MKRLSYAVLLLIVFFLPVPLRAQIGKPIYISLPGPGNVQHLAYVVAKEKKFYDEMGLTNVNIVVLRGNAMNVQALMSGSVHYSSAFGPSMQAMFRGEQIRVLLQIFNQIPFGLITRPEIKRLGRSQRHEDRRYFRRLDLQCFAGAVRQAWIQRQIRRVSQYSRQRRESHRIDARAGLGRLDGPADRPASC